MISRIVKFINENPVYETLYGFDYYWPASLGIPFLQTKTSYLEHFARDKNEKGIHSSLSDNPIDDFDRDRALSMRVTSDLSTMCFVLSFQSEVASPRNILDLFQTTDQ